MEKENKKIENNETKLTPLASLMSVLLMRKQISKIIVAFLKSFSGRQRKNRHSVA